MSLADAVVNCLLLVMMLLTLKASAFVALEKLIALATLLVCLTASLGAAQPYDLPLLLPLMLDWVEKAANPEKPYAGRYATVVTGAMDAVADHAVDLACMEAPSQESDLHMQQI